MSDDSDIQNNTGKRCEKPLNAASSSESSDNGSPLVTCKNSRKQLIVTSDDGMSNSEEGSSGSEDEEIVAIKPSSRGNALKIMSDYESGDNGNDSDFSGSSSDDENQNITKSNKEGQEDLKLDSSSDSDGQCEKCPICLVKFSTQEVGTPETCDHYFCALCIQEWAKNVNTCPVDRQPFTLILVRQQLEGVVVRQIPVNKGKNDKEGPEDPTFCEVCGQSDREDRMLLCDDCDNGYHMECLNPPLDNVPIDEWYCPECAPIHILNFEPDEREEQTDEVNETSGNNNRTNIRRARRLLPRTRQSERVRMTLRRRRTENTGPSRQRENTSLEISQQPSTSSGVESMEGEVMRRRRQLNSRRRKIRASKRRRKLRVRIKKIETDDGVIEVILKRKRKRKYRKKRKPYALNPAPHTTKGRLANKLGMCYPRITKQTIPETFNRQTINLGAQRHQAGIPTLDLFGRRNQLDYFSGSDLEGNADSVEDGVGGGSVCILPRVRVASARDQFHIRSKAAFVLSTKSGKKSIKIDKLETPADGNLLDSILDSQTLWHSKKTEIKSNCDGSLQVIPKDIISKVNKKIDVRNSTAPVIEAPMFPGGRTTSTVYKTDNTTSSGGSNQGENRNNPGSYDRTNYHSTGSNYHSTGSNYHSTSSESATSSSYSRNESSVVGSSLRGVAPIRFRMNLPPKRPNIHSYPTDNIPPPPPLRLKSPLVEMNFPVTNSPESSPVRDEEEIDIYSDIEQQSNLNDPHENEERTFGALEPPPEPPFLMTMEPPPEPPAILMNLNDDASDDEPSGLVIDDPPPSDVYDPCAINSDDSCTQDSALAKPPELPEVLKDANLVANYNSDSSTSEMPSYNPELPTYSSTPIIGPLPRPDSHNSSEADDNDEECPNFSMYSAASMNLAHRGFPAPISNLDIPIPPPIEENSINIPLPDSVRTTSDFKEDNIDIPLPSDEEDVDGTVVQEHDMPDDAKSFEQENASSEKESEGEEELKQPMEEGEHVDNISDYEKETCEKNEEEGDKKNEVEDNEAIVDSGDDNKSEGSIHEVIEKAKSKTKAKGSSEAGEDECSTQGDILDLAIENEANLENNITHDESEDPHETTSVASPLGLEESDDKINDGGDKSDGLVDITDEEMSVYDGQYNSEQENVDNQVLETSQNDKHISKSLYSDDENSLVGGATSAVSGATINNSDNVQPPTLPGLEGLETETISESEDVNFDELTLEGNERAEAVLAEEDQSSSRKKKKKKYRKISHPEDSTFKGNKEPLEFEEGEIIEDRPKKDKKTKLKPETSVEVDENIDTNKSKPIPSEKETVEKKVKKRKDKTSATKEKTDKIKEPKEKILKPGVADDNVSWKKLSKSTKERNYRDGKEKEEKEKDRENKDEGLSKKDKRSKEKRKELERYDVRRLISEKPKRPKKDEFGRDISPSKSGSSLSPYRPPRYRTPLRTRNRSRTRSRSWRSRSRSRGRRRRRSRSRVRVRSRDRSKRTRSRDRSRRRSRSKNKISSHSRERKKSIDRINKLRTSNRSLSRTRRKSRSPSIPSKRHRSYSRSWTPSWSRSSRSRSPTPRRRRRSKSLSRSRSRSLAREQNSSRGTRAKDPPKNLTVIVTNKEALKKKEKKKVSKKKDDRRKKKRGTSPAPSKEVFTSGDNILVSVNFKNANKNPELIPATTPLLRESSKRKRDELDSSGKKKKTNNSSRKIPGNRKSNRLEKINEATKNTKPVAIIDLDLSPFREQTPSPKEVIILSDSGDEGEKQLSEMQDEINRMSHTGMSQSMLSLSSIDHGQKNLSQPESPISSSFLLSSSGPKTPPEPHIKFSITTKPSQIRMLSNPLMEAEEEIQDENIENEVDEIIHKGPNTPPEPPPDLNTPASPPTTPYDPFDPTKSRSPSPQPRNSEAGSQINTSREDKLDSVQNSDDGHQGLAEPRLSTSPVESEEVRNTPELAKTHSTPKTDPNNMDISPKVSPSNGTVELSKPSEDTIMKPIQKLLAGANKLDVTVHKSPEKLITVVISQQTKNVSQTPKQSAPPSKVITPTKHQTPKGNTKHQLFSSSLIKQVPILGSLPLLPGPPVYTPSSVINSNNKTSGRTQQNGDTYDDMDIDPSSPYSPGSSEGDDLFEPPIATPPRGSTKPLSNKSKSASGSKFDALFGSSPLKPRHGRHLSKPSKRGIKPKSKGNKKEEVKVKLDEDQLKILDDLPSSAVEMQFLKKLNRQERVVEEVKLVLKPHYAKKHINKEEYKEILRRSVPKICHNKSGEINPMKIQSLIEAYVKKFRYAKKKTAGAIPAPNQNKPKPQKTLWS